MARRVSLPSADDLFRPTAEPAHSPEPSPPDRAEPPSEEAATADPAPDDDDERGASRGGKQGRQPSGRVRHDEKMTVYVTAEELLDLEHARLLLRRDHGLAVDRGRLVREAVALALADLDARGEESVIVQRLNQA